MASPFLLDSFTAASDSALADHPPETGSSWLAYGTPYTATATVLASEGRAAGSSSTASALYTNEVIPGSADYVIDAVVRFTSSSGKRVGLAARYSSGGSEAGYLAFYDGSYWWLRRLVNGVATDLASVQLSHSLNVDIALRFEVFGSLLSLTVAGTPRLQVTDSSLSTPGRVGVLVRSGGRIDQLSASLLEAQPARLAQLPLEVLTAPQPASRLGQLAVEVLTLPRSPVRTSQVVLEALSRPDPPRRDLAQLAMEVLWRDPRLAGRLAPRLSGVARLDLGLALAGEMGISVQGIATLSLGTEFDPEYGTVTASVSASLKTLPRLATDISPRVVGSAALCLGEELTAPGRLTLVLRGRFAGDTPTPSAFWLLF